MKVVTAFAANFFIYVCTDVSMSQLRLAIAKKRRVDCRTVTQSSSIVDLNFSLEMLDAAQAVGTNDLIRGELSWLRLRLTRFEGAPWAKLAF
jgi:hypothetical protein